MKSFGKIVINKEVLGYRGDALDIKKVFQKILKYEGGKKGVIIDFSSVRFVAGNFMDEWINVLEYYKKKGIKVIQKGRNENFKMIQKIILNRRKTILKSVGRFKL